MASRVSVNINVNDLSRTGLRSVRASLRRLDDQIRRTGGAVNVTINDDDTIFGIRRLNRAIRRLPDTVPITVTMNTDGTRRGARRVQRAIRTLPNNVTIRTNLVAPRRGIIARVARTTAVGLGRVAFAPFRQAGRILGGLMSDGIGQGIVAGFRSAGPVGIAVFAAILAGSVSLIGAALSGLLVAALGLAFISVAGVSAAQSEEVKKQWGKTLGSLKENFRSVGEPLIPVLEKALVKVEDLADRAAPKFKQAMEDAAPAIDTFIDELLQGFERFGETAFEPIMDAWNVFGPVFGKQFGIFLEDVGKNFGEIADMVRDHSVEIEIALAAVFKILSGIIEVINFLGEAWIWSFRAMNTSIDILINYGLIPLVETALNSFGLILEGASLIADFLPGGMGDALDAAKKSFGEFREKTMSDLEAVGEAAGSANEKLDNLNKTRKLEADIDSWMGKLTTASDKLKRTTNQKARAKLTADISDLSRKIGMAYMRLAAINGTTATTYVNTVYSSTSIGGHPTQRRKATGGNIGTAATGGARSNMTLVGEAGPELVDLAPGSRVRSNPDTRRALGAQAGSGGSTLLFKSSGRRVDDLLLEIMREAIHQRGGDPIAVLGG